MNQGSGLTELEECGPQPLNIKIDLAERGKRQ